MVTVDAVPNFTDIPTVVSKIVVSGANRIDDSVLKKQFVDLVKSTNAKQLLHNVRVAKERLVKLGVFKSVFCIIDVLDNSPNNEYKVIFTVEEKRPISARISVTHGSDGMTKLCKTLRVNNLLRGAESVDLDMEFGNKSLTSTSAIISKPLEANPNVRFRFGCSDGTWDHWWARFLRRERSLFSEAEVNGSLGLHRFQWDYGWRDIDTQDLQAPLLVRKESGSSMKGSIRHIFEHDTRSDMVFPDSGMLLRLTQELGSISPATNSEQPTDSVTTPTSQAAVDRSLQLKLEGVFQKPLRLTNWLVGELTFSTGMLHSVSGHKVPIADRFFLGGPLELRSFRWRSVSPVEPLLDPRSSGEPTLSTRNDADEDADAQDSHRRWSPVGTEAYWLTGCHLYTPLPYWGDAQDSLASLFRLHGFCVGGSTLESPVTTVSTALRSSDWVRQLGHSLTGSPRAVLGLGLVVRVAGVLRVEVNYCHPLVAQSGDSIKPGFQFGFGVYYM